MAETDRVRLHISPFNATLYQNIIPASIQPNATNISYHTVQTFPERGFGFVELPRADADKLRKKLNGYTLRGQKMAIQEAKPEKRRRRDKDDDAEEEVEKQPRKKAKKEKSSKKKDKEYTGFELPDDRQVKRGWTEEPSKYNKDKKEKSSKSGDKTDKTPRREKSKYSSKQEVLFKQKLPEAVLMAQKADGKDKKNKNSKLPRNISVIHEFEKNKPVPSFLKSSISSKTSATADFVPGMGWVDAEGNVIEEVQVKPKREVRIARMVDTPVEIRIKPVAPKEPAMHKDITAGAKALGYTSSSDESSIVSSESEEETSDDSDDDEEDDEVNEATEAEKEEIAEEIEEGAKEIAAPAPTEQQDSPSDNEQAALTKTSTPEPMETSPQPTTPREIHPLEALFKKKAPSDTTPRPAPINTSFSFGITDDIDEDMQDPDPQYPSTPYTRTRDIRSAAPTPDTAAIGRKFSFSFAGNNNFSHDEDIEEGYEDEDDQWQNANMEPLGIKEVKEGEEEEETEFAKWFWENRGDSNRAWKKRRRDVMKVKRQRENRRVSRRVV
ncbi:hypothetical protein E4T50_00258 [Aureobasidium sp. EXF-12298]|nr:hypothetical protein E4T50_00258 [Aureobasidium sp. EXF-12298]